MTEWIFLPDRLILSHYSQGLFTFQFFFPFRCVYSLSPRVGFARFLSLADAGTFLSSRNADDGGIGLRDAFRDRVSTPQIKFNGTTTGTLGWKRYGTRTSSGLKERKKYMKAQYKVHINKSRLVCDDSRLNGVAPLSAVHAVTCCFIGGSRTTSKRNENLHFCDAADLAL